ncbi:MAG: NAD-dependent epimerase/dehydratase family protein [Weeksellaceae bacterium]|jgi:nucleoside-diphosphate-sugar epimerase|nr:NAD-dependent epimerase/dehydratase family protein [Weeksellaceae bacterium]MDX9704262.1 NAD-dependent epimerase/dehydratase family protein [Weeksellaceae bacterium]
MVLVTGGSGLIGSYLLLELSKRGKKIRVLKRKTTQIDAIRHLFEKYASLENFAEIEWVNGDLLDIDSLNTPLNGIQTIYHTAAVVDFDDRKRKEIHEVNVNGTQNLVNSAIEKEVENIVFFSSIAVLDLNPGENKLTENSNWNSERAHSEYAISKKKAEMEIWRASQEGMNVLVLYPSIVIGSLDGKRESENIFRWSSKSNAYATKGITGFIDVRDVAFSTVELTEKEQWNESFLLNSAEKSYLEVFDFLRELQNKGKTRLLSTKKLKILYYLSFLSRLFGGKSLSKSSYHALISHSQFSNEKVKNRLSFSFIPVEEALRFHLNYYLSLKDKSY